MHGPLAGDVDAVDALGDDAVESAARVSQPELRHIEVARKGRELERRPLARLFVERLERGAAFAERRFDQALAFSIEQHVEQDEDRGRLNRELLDPAFGGMDAHLQRIE